MRLRATFTCPFCGGVLPNSELRAGRPVTCPRCARKLQPAAWHLRLSGLVALGLTAALCLLVGFQGTRLIVATALLWFPIYMAWDFLFVHIVRAPFVEYVPKDTKSGPQLF
jgi:uncharacterized paraquat-inducible protein A